jgi:hypothetical protein
VPQFVPDFLVGLLDSWWVRGLGADVVCQAYVDPVRPVDSCALLGG